MKNAIQLFAILIFVLASTAAFAQSFGLKAGLNYSNIPSVDDDGSYNGNSKSKLGFNAGITVEFPVSKMFSIETALVLSTKGFRFCQEYEGLGITYRMSKKTNVFYFDIPVNARLNIPVGSSKAFLSAGPYMGIALEGRNSYRLEIDGETKVEDDRPVYFGNNPAEDDYTRLDFGTAFGLGIQFNTVEVSVSYALGLLDISTYTYHVSEKKHRVLSISVGYKFYNNANK